MVSGFYPLFENGTNFADELDWGDEGVCLLQEIDALDEIATENGVELLSSFAPNRDSDRSEDDDDDEEKDEYGFDDSSGDDDEDEWFDPEVGIDTLDAIFQAVSATPDAVSDAESVIAATNKLRECLETALTENTRFRLVMF